MKLWLSEMFLDQFNTLQQTLPHAVILSGPRGVGLGTIARTLAGKDISFVMEPQNSKGELNQISGSIKVAHIRNLYEQTMGKSTSRQVVIIDDADTMTRGAQNAFLKLLEEPHPGLHFVLTTHHYDQLLATIRSRAQHYMAPRLHNSHDDEMINAFQLDTVKAKVVFIASGLPAEVARLAASQEYFAAKNQIFSEARQFLGGSSYEKTVKISKLKDRIDALEFCDTLLTILERSFYSKHDKALTREMDRILEAREAIARNASPRLQLLKAVL